MESRTNNTQARLRLISVGGIRIDESLARPRGALPPRKWPRVYRKKLLNRKVEPFTGKLVDHNHPMLLGQPTALRGLLERPLVNPGIPGHVRDGVPAIKDVFKGLKRGFKGHDPIMVPDSLSGQSRTTGSVTARKPKRTICPMGKATTPTSFKVHFCERIKSARITAGLNQADVAAELGIPVDTYSKYERRSLPPHFLIPKLCKLLDIETDFLFTGHRRRSTPQELRA